MLADTLLITANLKVLAIMKDNKWLLYNSTNHKTIFIDDIGMLLFNRIKIPQYIGCLRQEWQSRLASKFQTIEQRHVAVNEFIETLIDADFVQVSSGRMQSSLHDKLSFPEYPNSPKLAVVQPHNDCNLSCTYCYNADVRAIMQNKEITKEEWEDGLIKLAEAGIETFDISGGEPLLRKDLLPVYTQLRRKGARVFILTNGTLINSEADALMLKDSSDVVVMSIDSHIESLHDMYRGNGTHRLVVRAAALLTKEGVKWKGKAVFHPGNAGPLKDVREFVLGLGASDFEVSLAHGFSSDTDMAAVSYNLTQTCANKGDWNENSSYLDDVKLGVPCGAARGEIAIDAGGEVYPCRALMYPELACGSIFESDFSDIWKNAKPLQTVRELDYRSIDVCGQCNLLHICLGGCRAFDYENTKDFYSSPSSYLCAVRKRRFSRQLSLLSERNSSDI